MIIDEFAVDVPKSSETARYSACVSEVNVDYNKLNDHNRIHDSTNSSGSLGQSNGQSEFINEPVQHRKHLNGQLGEPRKRGRPLGSTRQEPVRGLLGHSGLMASSTTNCITSSASLINNSAIPSLASIPNRKRVAQSTDKETVSKVKTTKGKSNTIIIDFGNGGNGEGIDIEKGESQGFGGAASYSGLRELGDDELNLIIDECANAAS